MSLLRKWRLPRHSSLGRLDESDLVFDVGVVGGGVSFKGGERDGEVGVLFEEELFVGSLQGADVVFGESAALEADLVEATCLGVVAFSDGVRGDVLRDTGHASDDRMATDPAELMDGGESGNDGVIFDGDVAGEGGVVREDDVVAELAVVRDVGVAEEEVIAADSCRGVLVRAAMDGAVFAESVPITDFEPGRLAVILEILGFSANGGEGEELVVLADP